MDRELAEAVLRRWEEGLPVYEGSLYKAAELLDIDPDMALTEARFYTVLDGYLAQGGEMSPLERRVFSTAAGLDGESIEKTASRYLLSPEELILRALQERDWVPDLEKLADLAMGGPMQDPSMGMQGAAGGAMPGAMGGGEQPPGVPPPEPGAQVQQDPSVRFQPAPTAPEQVAPSPDGNFSELLQSAQNAQSADMGGGLPPSGMSSEPPPPPPPSPEEKIQSVIPDLPPESVTRYAEQLSQVEQQTGIPVTDPQQIQKLVQTLQKADKKVIDQAIKNVAEQAQAQAETAGAGVGIKPGNSLDSSAMGGAPPMGGAPEPPMPPPQGAGMVSPEAISKIASVARILAYANFYRDDEE